MPNFSSCPGKSIRLPVILKALHGPADNRGDAVDKKNKQVKELCWSRPRPTKKKERHYFQKERDSWQG